MNEEVTFHQREPTPQGVKFVLPRRSSPEAGRKVPGTGCVAAFMIPFGLIFAIGPLVGTVASGEAFAILFSLPFVFAGGVVLVIGLWLLIGRSEIVIANDWIRGIERAGPFWFGRKRRNAEVRKVLVSATPISVNNKPVEGFGNLTIEFATGKPFHVGFMYPIDGLQALARELIGELGLDHDAGEPVEVVEIESEPSRRRGPTSLEPPAGTKIQLSRNPVGLLFEVPPKGFRGTGCFLLVFATFWLGITSVVTFGFLLDESVATGEQPPLIFLIPFWAVGVLVLLIAIHTAKRRAKIAVVDGNLLIKRVGLFGTKSREIRGDEIRSIEVGRTNYQVNERTLPLLHIETGGKPVRMLDGREGDEIAWVAAVLRDELGVSDLD